jgi:hypothetical protein
MSLRKCYFAPGNDDGVPSLLSTENNMPFVSYRAASRLLLSAGAVEVLPSLHTDLALLRASLCSRLDALDDYARAMYTRRPLVMCMYISLTMVSFF